jgi:hypothetical protein
MRIEAVHLWLRMREPIHAVGILETGFEPFQEGMPDFACPMEAGVEGYFQLRLQSAREEDQQRHSRGIAAGNGEVDAIRLDGRPQR